MLARNFQLAAPSRALVVEALMLILCFPSEVFSG
jgi:hypothetical protein